jgi:hypothetical protein
MTRVVDVSNSASFEDVADLELRNLSIYASSFASSPGDHFLSLSADSLMLVTSVDLTGADECDQLWELSHFPSLQPRAGQLHCELVGISV